MEPSPFSNPDHGANPAPRPSAPAPPTPSSPWGGHRPPALIASASAVAAAILLVISGVLTPYVHYAVLSVLWILTTLLSAVLLLALCRLLEVRRAEGSGGDAGGASRVGLLPVLAAAAYLLHLLVFVLAHAIVLVLAAVLPTEDFFPASAPVWTVRWVLLALLLLLTAVLALLAGLRPAGTNGAMRVPLPPTGRAVVLLAALALGFVVATVLQLVVALSDLAAVSVAAAYVPGLGENVVMLLVIAAALLLAARADGRLRWAAPTVIVLVQLAQAAAQLLSALRYASSTGIDPGAGLGRVLDVLAASMLPLAQLAGAVTVAVLLLAERLRRITPGAAAAR